MEVLYTNKMSAEEIQKKIIMYKKIWDTSYETNCYAFALGLDIPENQICYHAYQPGVISKYYYFPIEQQAIPYEVLINGIYKDLDFLRVSYRDINPEDQISKDEWKISLFVPKKINEKEYFIDDFHFLKYYPDGYWYHKYGYYGKVINYDENLKKIVNPKDCFFDGLTYNKTMCLKLKKI